ncbi:hypothetical protein ONZ45_g4024 [Pleurotus djamor]|nr:hypothetical protein ONZ45_g4024 [Pleurotus djamor]
MSPTNLPGIGDVGAPPSPGVMITRPTPRSTPRPTLSRLDNISHTSDLELFGFGDNGRRRESEDAQDGGILNREDAKTFTSSPKAASVALASPVEDPFPRTVSFTSSARPRPQRVGTRYRPRRGVTMLTHHQRAMAPLDAQGEPQHGDKAKYQHYGGFPGPINVAQRALQYISPRTYATLERKLTISSTQTITGANHMGETVLSPTSLGPNSPGDVRGDAEHPFRDSRSNMSEDGNVVDRFISDISDMNAKVVSWLSFPLIVGRNSDIHAETLTDEQIEEVGGAEYRALRLLSYLVPSYFVLTQVFAYILFAPWLSVTHTYDGVFEAQPRIVQKPWFALFQVMGAYTGGGLSLVDMGMVPFQSAYLMIVAMMFVILAGNHALPILCVNLFASLSYSFSTGGIRDQSPLCHFLSASWIGYKITNVKSDTHKALEFLIDHPRRCFIYLAVEWAAFEVLNIGLPAFEALGGGPRVIAGLFQGLAARASGFSIVPLANFAPAIQFLYAVMMYIAVYPVAMSIRSTNVYEERSLGVFEAPVDDEDEEPTNLEALPPRERVGKYLDWHLRRQVSNDIWWLVWAVFFIAIIERGQIMDEDKKWFDLFRVLFELVSAFGGIGLTLGVPYDNFSFCGAMKPLSKLIIIVIMVRGRHRGLPLAVDRAIMLPKELNRQKEQKEKENANANANTTPSNLDPSGAPDMGQRPIVNTAPP